MTEDCLIEIGCEELPAQLISQLSQQISKLMAKCLQQRDVPYEKIKVYSTPRRIAIIITAITTHSNSKIIKKKGPYLANTKAAEGFAKSCNTTIEQLETITDAKGKRLFFATTEPGLCLKQNLLNWVELDVIKQLQGFKTMRWGCPGNFIRPVQWLLGKLGSKTLDGSLFNCEANNYSYGHRFMSDGKVVIDHAKDYLPSMRSNFVEPCPEQRTASITQQIATLTALQPELKPELLAEVTQLVEWPIVLIGSFAKDFLTLPAAALTAVANKHQRCFILKKGNKLSNQYVIVSNIISSSPDSVIAGNNHVITARLADACFFYQLDLKKDLAEHAKKLADMDSHTASMQDKVDRLVTSAENFAELLAVEKADLILAAKLCKADLACELVNELPEIQGQFAEHLAIKAGIDPKIARALASHRQQEPKDSLGRALAIIDQLDHITSFIEIGLQPTGDKDPFAIRRAASAVLHCLLALESRVTLPSLILTNKQDVVIKLIMERMAHWCRKNNISLSYLSAIEHLKSTGDVKRLAEILIALAECQQLEDVIASYKRLNNITKNADVLEQDLKLEQEQELELYSCYQEFAYGSAGAELTQLISLSNKVFSMLDNVYINEPRLKDQRLYLLIKVKELYLRIADFSKIS